MDRLFLNRLEDWDGRGLLSIAGATGSGKTAAALALVQARWPNELQRPLLVSMDSIAVYRGLDIGSAKPLGEEREPYAWHGIDLCDPPEQMNAARFAQLALPRIEAALLEERPVILVGGSHFYEKALVEGMPLGEASDPSYLAELDKTPLEALWQRLLARDARWATVLHPNDRYRIQRQLDLAERQGLSFDLLRGPPPRRRSWNQVATLAMGLDFSREEVSARLARRIHQMMEQGWIAEFRTLRERYGAQSPALACVGYREIGEFLNSTAESSLTKLEARILTAHLQLAKKQRTWLRGLRLKSAEQK
jgi:tRNA dimethylallyltransferase